MEGLFIAVSFLIGAMIRLAWEVVFKP